MPASVAVISGGNALLVASGIPGVLGTLLTIDGLIPWVAVPFLG